MFSFLVHIQEVAERVIMNNRDRIFGLSKIEVDLIIAVLGVLALILFLLVGIVLMGVV